MLLGVPLRPQLPPVPLVGTDVEGIRRYLQALDQAVFVYISEVLTGAVGLLGVRGISSSGIVAQNFVLPPVPIGNTSAFVIPLPHQESDPSYLLWIQSTAPASTVLKSYTRGTTFVSFNLGAAAPSGAQLHILLLR